MFGETLAWWLVVEAVGLLALPIAFVLFRRLPDRGYAFAKPVGILLGGYLFWLALTGHLLPNRPGSIVWVYLALAAVSAVIFRLRREEILDELRQRAHVILAVEVIFTAGLFLAAYLRSFIPEIDGTEKPMDFMFLNASSRSRFYPPADPWLSGFEVSYYYFGYVIQAMLGKLSALSTSVTYNLGLAGTAALAMTAAFGAGYNLVASGRRATISTALWAGGAAAVLLAVMGNLEGVLEFAKANGIGSESFYRSMGIANLAQAAQSDTWYPTDRTSFWWWWRATRVCPEANCIAEFPFFSFLLGDLHPHVMAIPFVLTAVGIGISLWMTEEPLNFDRWYFNPLMLLLTGVLIGGLGFLNTWDLPTFGSLLTLLVLARNVRLTGSWRQALGATAGFIVPLAVIAVIAYLPFYASFHSQASGIVSVDTAATRLLHAGLIWLPLVMLTLPVPLVVLSGDPASRTFPRVAAAAAAPVALLLVWAAVLGVRDSSVADAVSARGWNWLTTLFFAFAFSASALALWRVAERRDEEDEAGGLAPMLAMTVIGTLLILGGELFYIKDVFGSRLNTVFKLYYQAWLLLGIAGAFGLYWLVNQDAGRRTLGETLRGAWAGLAAVTIAGALLYPLGATLSRTEALSRANRSLDGLAFVKRSNPGESGAVDWIRNRAGPEEYLAEAVKGPYSDGGRIAARSGVPAVLGWPGHEVQWGRSGVFIGARQADIDRAYTTESLEEALRVLRKYGVKYVVVGSVERSKYPAAGLQKFNAGLQSVYRNGETAIYRLPIGELSATGVAP